MKGFFSGTKEWFFTVMKPFGLMKKNFGNIFEVNFRLFTFFVLFPVMTCLERLWLIGNKTTVITWDNLFEIIKNPLTWIVLILLGILLVFGTMFEQFALYDTLHACKFEQKRTLKQIFAAGFDLWMERMKIENLLMLPYTVLVLRFGTLTGDVSSVVTVLKIPGFILEDFHKHNWEKVAFLCFQVIAIYCFLRWIYSIPVMMDEDEKSFVTACKKSAAMTKGKHVIKVGFIALGWLLRRDRRHMVPSVHLADARADAELQHIFRAAVHADRHFILYFLFVGHNSHAGVVIPVLLLQKKRGAGRTDQGLYRAASLHSELSGPEMGARDSVRARYFHLGTQEICADQVDAQNGLRRSHDHGASRLLCQST